MPSPFGPRCLRLAMSRTSFGARLVHRRLVGVVGREADVLDADHALVVVLVADVPGGVGLGDELADAARRRRRRCSATDLPASFCSVATLASQPPSVSWMAIMVTGLPAAPGRPLVGLRRVEPHRARRSRACPACAASGGAKVSATGISSCGADTMRLAAARVARRRRRGASGTRGPGSRRDRACSRWPESSSIAGAQAARSVARRAVARRELGEHARAGLGAQREIARRARARSSPMSAAPRASESKRPCRSSSTPATGTASSSWTSRMRREREARPRRGPPPPSDRAGTRLRSADAATTRPDRSVEGRTPGRARNGDRRQDQREPREATCKHGATVAQAASSAKTVGSICPPRAAPRQVRRRIGVGRRIANESRFEAVRRSMSRHRRPRTTCPRVAARHGGPHQPRPRDDVQTGGRGQAFRGSMSRDSRPQTS